MFVYFTKISKNKKAWDEGLQGSLARTCIEILGT